MGGWVDKGRGNTVCWGAGAVLRWERRLGGKKKTSFIGKEAS